MKFAHKDYPVGGKGGVDYMQVTQSLSLSNTMSSIQCVYILHYCNCNITEPAKIGVPYCTAESMDSNNSIIYTGSINIQRIVISFVACKVASPNNISIKRHCDV